MGVALETQAIWVLEGQFPVIFKTGNSTCHIRETQWIFKEFCEDEQGRLGNNSECSQIVRRGNVGVEVQVSLNPEFACQSLMLCS